MLKSFCCYNSHEVSLFGGCIYSLCGDAISGISGSSPLLCVKMVHLVDKRDPFKISNLVYNGTEIVRSLYSSLQGRRQTVYGGYSEIAGSVL